MNIIWYGQTCFSLTFQKGKENVNVFFNPLTPESGLKPIKKESDILILNHDFKIEKNNNSFLVNSPGEYEIKDIFINGLYSFDDNNKLDANIIYLLEGNDLKICHLGLLQQKELTKEQLNELGDVDILLVPIGGARSIEAKDAVKIVSQIEPKIIIPMYYQIGHLKEKLEDLNSFLKILGIKSVEPLNKFSIKKKELLTDEPKVIILEP